MGILTFLVLFPLLGGLVLLFLKDDTGKLPKTVGMSFGVGTLIAVLAGLLVPFSGDSHQFQFVERGDWFPSLGIAYHLGVDGVSTMLIALTSLLTVIALAFSLYVDKRAHMFFAMILLLEAAMIGAFASLDLILFFTFFEATLVPMWLMINLWGGERRAYAANKFLVYTFAGSIFLLVGMVALALQHRQVTGNLSFDIVQIQAAVANGTFWTGAVLAPAVIFWMFAIAFLIKAPAFPFHTWIPDTYAEAPTAGPILSSAMVKLGTYGFLRFILPIFPDVLPGQIPVLATLAVIGIVYGAIVAIVQPDMRRLLAYSSLSHMGFVLLGIFSLTQNGMIGGAYQQLNHGITASMLFLLVGFLYQRRGTTQFRDYGGLKSQMPLFAALFLIGLLGSVGLPGTNGFVGEFLAMLGMYEAGYQGLAGLNTGFAIAAGAGTVLAAVYLLYMFQQVFYGPIVDPINRRLRDLKRWEVGVAGVLALFVIWGGLAPTTFIRPMEASLDATRKMATEPVGQRPVWGQAAPNNLPQSFGAPSAPALDK
ncbi:MAG: complex I subunit 4 family protein [Fimbriimonas sp.]